MPDDEHDEHETPGAPAEISEATEDRIVDRVIAAVREIVGPEPKASASMSTDAPATGSGPAAQEADMERRVREEVDAKITQRERRSAAAEARAAHDAEHERIRSMEKPPRTFSRLTTAMWGGDDS